MRKFVEGDNVDLMKKCADRIRDEIKMDGLVWGQDYKIEEVAFGVNKL